MRFLSDEWLDAAAGLAGAGDGAPLCVLEQVVRCDDRVVRYQLCLREDGAGIDPNPALTPDLVIAEDYDTAAAISRGELDPGAALAAGRVTISGDAGRLAAAVDVLTTLDDALAPLRARTEY